MKTGTVLAVILMLCVSSATLAASFDVSVTRQSSNVYRVLGKQVLIHTRYCYEYATADDAVLNMQGRSGHLIFLEDKETCDVEGVYAPVDQAPGKYSISVSQDADDWYAVDGTGLHIHTTMCLNLAMGADALLKLDGMGVGTLYFLDDDDHCDVDGVYGVMSL